MDKRAQGQAGIETIDLFFLTTEPSTEVGAIHPEAMRVTHATK